MRSNYSTIRNTFFKVINISLLIISIDILFLDVEIIIILLKNEEKHYLLFLTKEFRNVYIAQSQRIIANKL